MNSKSKDWEFHFCLDREAGVIYWKSKPISYFKTNRQFLVWNKRFSGKKAGTISKKNKQPRYSIIIDKKHYNRSRIVWEMIYGDIPEGKFIDHINGNSLDDRPVNLRIADRSQNAQNSKPRNVLGLKGVVLYKKNKKYGASIKFNGSVLFLGLFDTKGLAALAYAKESLRRHGRFSYYYRNAVTP